MEKKAASASAGVNPGINLNCIYDHLQKPPESFHYVYKKDTSSGSPVDREADITPQTIDGVRKEPDGTSQPLHAVASDAQSWRAALVGLTGISGMSSAMALIHNNSASQRETDGAPLNGYPTVHYSIDTARWDATTRQTLGGTLGPGGFEKSDVWVTAEGCPVKLVLDSELHKNDGSLLYQTAACNGSAPSLSSVPTVLGGQYLAGGTWRPEARCPVTSRFLPSI